MADSIVVLGPRLDVAATLGGLAMGRFDPTMRIERGHVWRASRTPDGPGTIHLRPDAAGLRAEAWGPGASWLLQRAGAMAGLADDRGGFEPHHHPLVAELARRHDVRIARTERVLERLVPTILCQKVTGLEAKRGWAALVRLADTNAPGPVPLLLPPAPTWLASLPSFAFHRARASSASAPTPSAGPPSTPTAWKRRSPSAEMSWRDDCWRCRASDPGRWPRCRCSRSATPTP